METSVPAKQKGFDRATHTNVAKDLRMLSTRVDKLAEEIDVSYPKTGPVVRTMKAIQANLTNLRASLNGRYCQEHGGTTPYYPSQDLPNGNAAA